MATQQRGFASMSPEKQREIASKGGRAAHQKGTAHQFSSEEARAAGRKGGEAVSRNSAHMAEIGRRGGVARSTRVSEAKQAENPPVERATMSGNERQNTSERETTSLAALQAERMAEANVPDTLREDVNEQRRDAVA